MRLYITQKDFDEGVKADCGLCPVGRSANRAAKKRGYWRASVGDEWIYFEVLNKLDWPAVACTRHLSTKVTTFIRDFDQGKIHTFKPFSLTIQDIPNLIAGNPG